jgi:hypothetical protein
MKYFIKLITFLLLILFTNTGFGQTLSLDELVDLRKKNLSKFIEYLNPKGWINSDEAPLETKKTIVESFESYKLSNKTSKSTIEYLSSNDTKTNRISIHISQKETYSQYLTKIISLGYRLIKAELENGDIIKVYQGKKNTIKVTTKTDKSNYSIPTTNSYIFLIY